MKVGDIIRRKDMPQILCKIIGERNDTAWYVETISHMKMVKKKALLRRGLIFKDDERWEVAE